MKLIEGKRLRIFRHWSQGPSFFTASRLVTVATGESPEDAIRRQCADLRNGETVLAQWEEGTQYSGAILMFRITYTVERVTP